MMSIHTRLSLYRLPRQTRAANKIENTWSVAPTRFVGSEKKCLIRCSIRHLDTRLTILSESIGADKCVHLLL